jgi:ribosome-associated protein YbcJ (S4-like RNA binding protein)
VQVDGSPEDRRGRKLYPGMRVVIPDVGTIVLVEGHHVS